MTTIPKFWTFGKLPQEALNALLVTRVIDPKKRAKYEKVLKDNEAKQTIGAAKTLNNKALGSLFDDVPAVLEVQPITLNDYTTTVPLRIGTDMYEGYDVFSPVQEELLKKIKPRVEKSAAEQKKRTKEKAEVFTPLWVVKAQNDLLDEGLGDVSWLDYLTAPVLEITCGEGPYLMSPYDATTGAMIPVRDEEGNFSRVGLMDRKFQKLADNVSTLEQWEAGADVIMEATNGYEWQGDNLVLARLNFINTYFDYLTDFCNSKDIDRPSKERLKELAVHVAEYASEQLWQMDGLKMVIPGSCSDSCVACKKKKRTDHNGLLSVCWLSNHYVVFENLVKIGSKTRG